jgi:DNA-binding CsgD family transcriptional regulator
VVNFNSKQLEQLEHMHDSSGSFDSEDGKEKDDSESGDAAMEWRRGLLEEAAENVKRARTRPVDPDITYEIDSMLFDRDTRRFARVKASVPGYLRIVYLTGGDREYGLLDVDKYLADFGATKKLGELSSQLGINSDTVDEHLGRLGITPVPDDEEDKKAKAKEEKAKAKAAKAEAKAKGEGEAKTDNKKKPAAKATAAKAAKKKATKKGAKKAKGSSSSSKGGPADPIESPNDYIKQNFREMSNRELARETGLSEHTIRRKLGEWSLKRKR